MRGQAGPSSKELKSIAEFDKFVDSDDISVIGLFEGESKLKDSFHKVADTERDRFRFGHSTNADVLKKAGYNEWEKENHIIFHTFKIIFWVSEEITNWCVLIYVMNL